MTWSIKLDEGWITVDDGTNHVAIKAANVTAVMTAKQEVMDGELETKAIEVFRIKERDGNGIYFPCHDRKYARFCARRITRLLTS